MAEDEKKPECPGGEYATMLGPEIDGQRVLMHHRADHSRTLGVAQRLPEGKPIDKDSFILKERPDGRYDLHPVSECTGRDGPPKVTSKAYRDHYDNIFGTKQPVGEA